MLATEVISRGIVRGKKNPLWFGLAERLKRIRKERDLAVQPFEEGIGLSGGVIRSIEKGTAPKLDTIEKIATALKVSPCWLAYGIETTCAASAAGVGERLATAREERGLSQRALARAAEVAAPTVRSTESGRSIPTVATAEQLAKALKVSPCWLAFDSEG